MYNTMETTTPIAIVNGNDNGTSPSSPEATTAATTPAPHFSHYGTPCAGVRRRDTPPLASSEHLGGSRQYWRDIILGVNDGLISTFLLVAGVAGGGLSSNDILLTAIAGSLAGAVSMATGEYVATKSQNEVMEGELALELEHVSLYPEDEIHELCKLLPVIGVSEANNPTLVQQLLDHYRQHPEALLKVMTALEFGVLDEEVRSPIRAGLFSCLLFVAGSLPSVLPFCFSGLNPTWGLVAAALSTSLALFAVGAVKSWATRGNCWTAAIENLIIAGCGGVFAYVVGLLFDHVLHGGDDRGDETVMDMNY
uniref:Uncharacterized protein n=1 Tax=Amphora coffeiformis TaxID=265554 RepID=A0A7S3KVS4_9STRA|mmetsp:Transcript_16063/g.30572  ORF Transcript_16063/g.30572 Transcript_16063/m.30572 type:complete len:309 (+) Transcript_16063:36-962(+)